nr:reverse transcriptase domain-containing protein [Tanacetum cinerariifolium]
LGNGFALHWIGDNIPNNQNGWIEKDAEEEEEDPEEDPKEDPKEDLEGDRSRDKENLGRNEVILCPGMVPTKRKKKVKAIAEKEADNKKRKWENFQGGSSGGGGNSNSNWNNNNCPNNPGKNVKCNRCGMKHYGDCPIKCNKCGKIGRKARDCWSKVVATGANAESIVTCYGCGEKGHIKTNCHARSNPGRSGAREQAYALIDGDQNLGPNVTP